MHIYVSLALLGMSSGRLGKQILCICIPTCSASAHFAYLGRGFGSRFCRYLRCFRSLCLSGERLGKLILSLFAVLPLTPHIWGEALEADFVAICGASAHFAYLGKGLGSRYCRYLRCFRSLCISGERLGKQILSLFAVLPLTLHILGEAWEA